MLGVSAAKRANAPFLALPTTPCRSYYRPSQPSGPYNRNATRRPPSRSFPPRSPPLPPPPPPHSPMTGPYQAPVPIFGAPTYAEQWPTAVGGGWPVQGYYSPPEYRQPGPPPSRSSNWNTRENTSSQRGHRGPSREPRNGLPFPRRGRPTAEEEFPTVYPSFTYQPPNFEKELRIAASPDKLYFQEVGNEKIAYQAPAISMRDKCNCSRCRDAASSQKNFKVTEIPDDLTMAHVAADEQGLRITYRKDIPRLSEADGTHVQVYPWSELERQRAWTLKRKQPQKGTRFNIMEKTGVVHWDRDIIANRVRSIDYEEYIKGGDAMWDAIVDLTRFGIVFLRNVPADPTSINRITTTIAPIQSTFYGETFDVRAKPDAENVAYTSEYLGLHQDLLYLTDTPQIQVLHCLENSCSGGESLFSDSDRIGRLLTHFIDSSDAVSALTQCPVHFGYDNNGSWYYQQKKSAMHTSNGYYRHMWWSPPFESQHGHVDLKPEYIRGARLLETLLNEPESVYERKMEPGECVLFDNRRVMHGRNAFDAQGGGSRWLRGAYISKDDWLSKSTQIPDGYGEKTRDGLRVDVLRNGLQDSLRNTHWFDHVTELVARDEAQVEEAANKVQEDRRFRQQVRQREGWEMRRN